MGEARIKKLLADNRALCGMLVQGQKCVELWDAALATDMDLEEIPAEFREAMAEFKRLLGAPAEEEEPKAPESPRGEPKIAARLARGDPEKLARFRAAAARLDVHEGKGEAVRDAIAGARAAADLATGKIQG